jgi:DNA-binding LytR/AlgR family response regulator
MEQNYIWIKQGSCLHKVAMESILFILINKRSWELYTDDVVFRFNCSLQQFLENAPRRLLIPVNHSHAVNLHRASSITRKEIVIAGHCIPLGRGYARALFKQFKFKA